MKNWKKKSKTSIYIYVFLKNIDVFQTSPNTSKQWKQRFWEDLSFLSRVITCDETWAYHLGPQTKQESATWWTPHSPLRKKMPQAKSAGKALLFIFSGKRGIIYRHIVPYKQTVNSDYYCGVLTMLFAHIAKKRPKLKKNFILHYDNTRPHTSRKMAEFLEKHKVEVMEHPPYRPDLTPCDFWLFLLLKAALWGTRFSTDEQVVVVAHTAFNTIDASEFAKMWVKWRKHWDKCIALSGRYFENECTTE